MSLCHPVCRCVRIEYRDNAEYIEMYAASQICDSNYAFVTYLMCIITHVTRLEYSMYCAFLEMHAASGVS